MTPAILVREATHDMLRAVFDVVAETTIGGMSEAVHVGADEVVAVVRWRDDAWWIARADTAPEVEVGHELLRGERVLRHGDAIESARRPGWRLRFLIGDRATALDELRHAETVLDGLTGLLDRRTAYRMLDRMTSGVVMLIDLDRLKQLNDRCGMMAGDAAIRRTAEIVKARVAWPAVAARYGGEELVVVMPEASLDDARALAEQIRVAAEPTFVFDDMTLEATVSIGLGVHTGSGTVALRAADEALAQAKTGGRNRVIG